MYGDAPPAIVAVSPALLGDPAAVRAVAWSLEAVLRRQPVWVMVPGPPCLARRSTRLDAMRHLADDPAWRPDPVAGAAAAAVAVLQRVLGAAGLRLPAAGPQQAARMGRPASALVAAGTDGLEPCELKAATRLARTAGSGAVVWWRPEGLGAGAEAAAACALAGLDVRGVDPRPASTLRT